MIRCTQCGYKNSPVYHYCGVCGAVLQAAPKENVPAAKPAAATPAPVTTPAATDPVPPSAPVQSAPLPPPRTERGDMPASGGMSFLGLSDAPRSSSPSYLLDDEEEAERSVAWGRILIVLILLGAAGGLGWQWYRGAYPFAPHTPNQAATAPGPVTTPAPADSAAAPTTTPTPAPAAETPAPDASKPAEPTASARAGTIETTPPDAAKTETPAETKPTEPAAAEKIELTPPEKTPAPVEKAAKVAPARVKPPAPVETAPPVPPGESLYIQGQRYLYGNGVAPNCDLAVKSLLSAAARAHPKAQSTLGAMYSTGHCVTRDLPTAYRWFAKALRQDPNNTRLEQDLSVVWRQMTPGEQQQATRRE
jgi:hypothetical protein